ncbi:MAG: hypothetical protein ABW002_18945 [Xanthomonas sp.]
MFMHDPKKAVRTFIRWQMDIGQPMPCRWRSQASLAAALKPLGVSFLFLLSESPAKAQQISPIALAEDAFGSSAGGDEIGIYSQDAVRGFSPVEAGNVRIEGLYADIPQGLGSRTSYHSSVRVGNSAATSLWSAPSGIIDYALRDEDSPRDVRIRLDGHGVMQVRANTRVGTGSFVGAAWSGSGASYNGSRPEETAVGGVHRGGNEALNWAFFAERSVAEGLVEPSIYPTEPAPLPRYASGRYYGQKWLRYRYVDYAAGALMHAVLSPSLRVDAGIFRAATDSPLDGYDVLSDVAADGMGDRQLYSVAGAYLHSWSGDVLVRYTLGDVDNALTWFAGLQGRAARAESGRSQVYDIGRWHVAASTQRPRPPQPSATEEASWDTFRQVAVRAGFLWKTERWLVRAGVSPAYLHQRSGEAMTAVAPARTSSQLLYSGMVRAGLPAFSVFASVASALEQNGVAPQSANNRGSAIEPSLTRQVDLGVSGAVDDWTWTGAVFRISRPHASLDASGNFGLNGTLVHQGVEASSTWNGERQTLLIGGYLLHASSTTADGIRERPIATPRSKLQASWEYRASAWPVVLSATATYLDQMRVGVDGSARLPPSTVVDVDAQYDFTVQGRPSSLSLAVNNATDTRSFESSLDGGLVQAPGRELVVTFYMSLP